MEGDVVGWKDSSFAFRFLFLNDPMCLFGQYPDLSLFNKFSQFLDQKKML